VGSTAPGAAVTVTVVEVDLGGVTPAALAACDAALPADERDVAPARRVARAALRTVLGDALGVAPADVPISRRCAHCGDPVHGKPFVPGAALACSLTHTGTLALVAWANAPVALGVDAERVRPRVHLDRLAARVLGPAEHTRWRALPEAERCAAFLRAWTAKEAYVKATGRGIAALLGGVPATVPGWTVGALPLPEGYVGALAVDAEPVGVVRSVWDPAGRGPAGGGGPVP